MPRTETRKSPERTAAVRLAPMRSDVVRISLPASVAYDMGALQKTLVGIAERLGCRPCFSGADCLFRLERDFVVDPAGQIQAIPALEGRLLEG